MEKDKSQTQKEYIEDQKMLGEYAGLTYTGEVDENDDPIFTGTKKQWSDYEDVRGEEVFYDERNEKYHIGVGSDKIIIA